MILVDRRRGSHELKAPLTALGLPVEETTLDYGDLLFEGRGEQGKPVTVAIEYKKLSELVTSLRTGRLQGHQALGMQTFDFRWLLIEGELIYDKRGKLLRRKGRQNFGLLGGGMSVGELYKRLLVLQLRLGLIPMFTRQRRDSLKWIEALYRTWTDVDLDQHKSHIAVYDPPTLIPLSDERKLYMKLPGIGVKTSKLIEQHFTSPYHAFTANPQRWKTIEGIGAKTAQQITNFIFRRT